MRVVVLEIFNALYSIDLNSVGVNDIPSCAKVVEYREAKPGELVIDLKEVKGCKVN